MRRTPRTRPSGIDVTALSQRRRARGARPSAGSFPQRTLLGLITVTPVSENCMKFRRLGESGLKISELSLGNWLTHGDLIDADAAIGCVHEALDLGISTFDTAD